MWGVKRGREVERERERRERERERERASIFQEDEKRGRLEMMKIRNGCSVLCIFWSESVYYLD